MGAWIDPRRLVVVGLVGLGQGLDQVRLVVVGAERQNLLRGAVW